MAVEIELVGGKIFAKIPWMDGNGPELAKSIPGARSKYEKQGDRKKFIGWVYPADMEVCRTFRKRFGSDLRIGTALADWARAEIAREADQLALRSKTDATLTRVPELAPALAKAMESRTYQRVGARFAVDGRTVLIADEPGIGKTLETLAALVEDGARIALVFAKKKAIRTVWGNEVPRWLGDYAKVYPVDGTTPQRQKALSEFKEDFRRSDRPPLQIVVCNIEMVRRVKVEQPCQECNGEIAACDVRARHKTIEEAKFPELFEPKWDAIVVDESHKALIGKNVMSKSIPQARLGMMRLKLRDGGMKIALSGTPARGKQENLWGTLNWLNPKLFSSYWRWAESYFVTVQREYGGMDILDLQPEKEADFDRMLARWMIRRTKAEVAPEMPPRLYGGTPLSPRDPDSPIGVWLDLEPAQARQYRKLRHDQGDGILKLESGGSLFLDGLLSELTRQKQFAVCDWALADGVLVPAKPQNSNKYQWLKEFVEERIEAGKKVVVCSQFSKVVEAFSAWLQADGIASYTLTGATSGKAVAASIAAFQDPSDSVPVFLINTYAGGESINLDCADDIVFLDETFIPDDQEQAENRVHRMSRMHNVTVWYLRSLGTIEEQICLITGAREVLMKKRLDGSRGIETVRRLLAA